MARATILGDVIQIKSRLTKEQLERAENFKPGTSVLEDGNGNEVFRIEYGKSASFSKYGISFCSTDENGFIFLTVANNIEHNDNIETERRKIRDEIGVILHKCNMVEDAVIDALGEINEINDAIDSSVVIIDDSEAPIGIIEDTPETSVTFE